MLTVEVAKEAYTVSSKDCTFAIARDTTIVWIYYDWTVSKRVGARVKLLSSKRRRVHKGDL